jgi:hypothetical protein
MFSFLDDEKEGEQWTTISEDDDPLFEMDVQEMLLDEYEDKM